MSGKVSILRTVLMTMVLVLLICDCGIYCFAAAGCDGSGNCYVRSGATSGTRTGIDWANAYIDLPANLTRGVTYWVAGGTYGGHVFNDVDSGNIAITVMAPTTVSHGTSIGWNDSYQAQALFQSADTSGVGTIFSFTKDYYVINGTYRSSSTGNPQTDWQSESAYGFKTDNSRAIACYANIGFGTNSATAAVVVHDITFEYVDVNGSHANTDAGCRENGIDNDWGSYNLTVSNNYIHDVGASMLFLHGQHCANGSVVPPPCTRGTAPGGGTYGPANNESFEYNYFSRNYSTANYHAEGGSISEGTQDLTLAYNYWQDINGTAIIAPASACDFNNCNQNNGPWYIYGNVVLMTSCAAASGGSGANAKNPGIANFFYLFDSQFSGNVYIINNTIANYGTGCGLGSGVMLGDGGYTNPMQAVYVMNNAWVGAAQISISNACPTSNGLPTCTSMTWTDNAYFATTDSSPSNDSDPGKQVATSNAIFNSAASFDYRLASDTSVGAVTSAILAANATDLLGTARGADGTWDRGAFQVPSASASMPSPPTGLTATVR
ncbi:MULTISPECIES: hypothetical protein [Acidobacteriaceae]|uniref:hypothetical protein n=1 Tax=Acidobacteriaceae TaxID=204434 RepID=UPI00131E9DFB|nr:MULTISPECIES: hypothetical protein [Acidobacteriaceae]MDW5265952.1 hypothetical protein [Edaphobacter sp.]